MIVVVASFEDDEKDVLHRLMDIIGKDTDYKVINRPLHGEKLVFEGMIIEPQSRNVLCNGENIALTVREFDILYLLAKRPGQIFTKEQIYELVWNEPYYNAKDSVISMIRRIRVKIEADVKNPIFIQTVWGIGYKFNSSVVQR